MYARGSKPWLNELTYTLLTSSSNPQSASCARRERNSHSVIVDEANSTYEDGFSRTRGRSRASLTCRTRATVWRNASSLYGIGRRSCTFRPATPVQHR